MSQQRPRGPRTSIAAPNNATLGAVVAVVALLLGFLILRDVNADSSPSAGGGGNVTDSIPSNDSVDPATPTTIAFSVSGFKIQIANASGVARSAAKMTTDLQGLGYVVQPPLNTAPGTPRRSTTGVFYLAGCEAGAENVKQVLGGNVEVGAMPSPVPLETGDLDDACVLILVGTDLAGKPLPSIGAGSGDASTGTTTTVPQQ
jgi:hypothetical protein